jgi:hypothetical protein
MTRHLLVLLLLALPCAALAGEQTASLTSTPGTLTIPGVARAVAPTLVLTGKTVVTETGARRCLGPAINGTQVAEDLLTNERLTLQFGSGVGEFYYDPGFAPYPADPQAVKTSLYFNKYKYDMFSPAGGGNMFDSNGFRFLWTSVNGQPRDTVYRFAFPEGVQIKQISFNSVHRLEREGGDVLIFASRDPEGKEVLAKGVAGAAGPWPITIAGFAASTVYLHITSEHAGGPGYGETMWIRGLLDISGLPKLTLKPGDNTLTYTDAPESSHQADLKVIWHDEPLVSGFEGPEGTKGWSHVVQQTGLPAGADSGLSSGRIDWEYHKEQGGTNAGYDAFVQRDWSKYQTLSLAVNCPEHPPGQIAIGFYDQGGGEVKPRFSVVSFGLQKTDGWQVLQFDISKLQRGNVLYLTLYSGQGWSEGQKYTFYVDDLALSEAPVVVPPRRDAQTLAALRANILPKKPVVIPDQPGNKPIPPLRDFFPIGAWAPGDADMVAKEMGVDEWLVYQGVMEDFKRHHQNMIMWTGPGEALKVCRLAEVMGLRLYRQGPDFFSVNNDPAVRKQYWERIQRSCRDILPRFRGYWGLLCWEITEEIPPEMVADLTPYYQLVNELDPEHPGVIVHNNAASAALDAKTNHPPVICADIYPILNRSDESIRSYYKSLLTQLWKNADSCGAVAWTLPQSYQEGVRIEGESVLSRRHPTPIEMKWQAWCAVAHGCTGLILFGWDYPTPKDYAEGLCTSLKTPTGEDTPQWQAWGEVSAVMEKLAPTLLKLRHVDETFAKASADLVQVHGFREREGQGRYVIAVNDDFHQPQRFALAVEGGGGAQDVLTGKTWTAQQLRDLTLPAGEGMLLRLP